MTDLALSADPFPDLSELPFVALSGPEGDLVEAARRRAMEEGRSAGYSQGMFEGRARGEAEGLATMTGAIAATLESIERAAASVAIRESEIADALSRSVLEAAMSLAEAIVGHEVSVAESPGMDAIVRALQLAPESGPLVARLHPTDAELVGEVAETAGRSIQVQADPTVEPGGCLLRTSVGMIDAQLSAAVQRTRAVLLGTSEDDA